MCCASFQSTLVVGIVIYIVRESKRQAIDAYEQAAKVTDDPTIKALAWNNKAYALIQLSRYDEAISAIAEGIRQNNEQQALYKNKGLACESLGEPGKALAAYHQAVKLDESYQTALNLQNALIAAVNSTLNQTLYKPWNEIIYDVSIDKVWTIEFNRPVDLKSVDGQISLTRLQTDPAANGDASKGMVASIPLEIQPGSNANEITIRLTEGTYEAGQSYFLYTTGQIQDQHGNKLNQGIRLIFSTEE